MNINHYLPMVNHNDIPPHELEDMHQKPRPKVNESGGLCQPDCDICLGLGYVRVGNGLLEFCPRLSMWDRPGSHLYGLHQAEASELRWENIFQDNNIEKAVEVVKHTIDKGYGWVFIHGSFGLGKTVLLKTAVAETLQKKINASYVRMAEILDHLRQGFSDIGTSETERLSWWSKIPVLAIDEFDRIRLSEYAEERRFVLMDRRYELALRNEGATIIASNSAPNGLPGYLFDRIRDGRFHIVELTGKSWRPGLEW